MQLSKLNGLASIEAGEAKQWKPPRVWVKGLAVDGQRTEPEYLRPDRRMATPQD